MSRSPAEVWRTTEAGIALKVRLTPKSSADRVDGIVNSAEGPAIAARVRAIPAEGEANTALERLVADWLGVAKSCVALTAGQKSRIKTVTVRGDAAALMRRLAIQLQKTEVENPEK